MQSTTSRNFPDTYMLYSLDCCAPYERCSFGCVELLSLLVCQHTIALLCKFADDYQFPVGLLNIFIYTNVLSRIIIIEKKIVKRLLKN